MVKLTAEIRDSLAGTKIAFFATAGKDANPNAVPVGAFKVFDDETIIVSDQFFNKTAKNIKENPKAALTWWGEKAGFQVKGTVTIHTDGKIFDDDVAWVKGLKPNLNPKAAILMKVTDVYSIKPGADAGKKIL